MDVADTHYGAIQDSGFGTHFEVSIGRSDPLSKYRVDIIDSPAGFASSLTDLDVEGLLARRSEIQDAILASAAPIRQAGLVTERPVREVGQALFTALLGSGEIVGQYRAAQALTANRGQALRIILRIDSPALAALPWEAMYDHASGYISRQEPLIRHIPTLRPPGPIAAGPPLRILAVISSPTGVPALDVDKERELLTRALAGLIADGLVEIHWAPSATWGGLHELLIGRGWQVFHYIGHGYFDARHDEGVIVLTDQNGQADLVEANRFADLLHEARPMPRMVVLNSCAGAAASTTELFSGTAAALTRAGVPVVVAMQYEISDRAAGAFSGGLYTAIANGRRIDDAVSSGRVAILGTSGDTLEWLTPVIYQRGHQSWLFKQPVSPPAGPPVRTDVVRRASHRNPKSRTSQPRPALSAPRRQLRIITGHTAPVIGVGFSPDGGWLVTASYDKRAHLWETATGNAIRAFAGHESRVWGVALSPDGAILATGSHDKTARLWATRTGVALRVLRGHSDSVYEVALSADGAMVATGSVDRTARLWDASSGRPVHILNGHASYVHGVAFSPDNAVLATTSTDQTARLWDVDSGRPILVLAGHDSAVAGVAFSPDGALLATASSDKTVRLWRRADGSPVHVLTGHAKGVAGVAFSPDGGLLATSSYDHTVRLWAVVSGDHLVTLIGHTAPVLGVAFSHDGTLLASASNDRTVRLWTA